VVALRWPVLTRPADPSDLADDGILTALDQFRMARTHFLPFEGSHAG